MNNTTNVVDHLDDGKHPHSHDETQHQYYLLIVLLLYLGPIFVFNIVLMVAIVTEKTVPAAVRFLLSNIVAASELVVLGLSIVFIHNVLVTEVEHLRVSAALCHVTYFTLTSACAARFLFMAAYAVTIYALIRKKVQTEFKLWPILLSGAILWLVASVPNTWLVSNFVESTFHEGAFCASHPTNNYAFIYPFGYIVVYGGGSFTIAILFPILAFRYAKHNSTYSLENTRSIISRAMLKFTLFLLLGNTINFLGTCIPILFAAFAPNDEEHLEVERAFTYIEGLLIMASLIPTPVIILVFFDTIRRKFTTPLLRACKYSKLYRNSSTSSSSTSANNNTTVDINKQMNTKSSNAINNLPICISVMEEHALQ